MNFKTYYVMSEIFRSFTLNTNDKYMLVIGNDKFELKLLKLLEVEMVMG